MSTFTLNNKNYKNVLFKKKKFVKTTEKVKSSNNNK